MSDVPDKSTFASLYSGQAPWDIGKPQKAFLDDQRPVGSLYPCQHIRGGGFQAQSLARGDEATASLVIPEADRVK